MINMFNLIFSGTYGGGKKDRGVNETARRGNGKAGGRGRVLR